MIYFRIKRTVRLGLTSLWLHRLRSALTVLGIVFGVCSVIAMLAIGEGASQEAQEQIKKLGSQNIIVRSVQPPASQTADVERSFIAEYGLTYSDAERIQTTIPSVEVLVPSRIFPKDIWSRGRRISGRIVATVPWMTQVANRKAAVGRFLTIADMHTNRSVCVMGADLVKALFPNREPLGETVKAEGAYFRVVGVMAEEGPSAAGTGESVNLDLYIPITTGQATFGETIMRRTTGSRQIERIELSRLNVRVASLGKVLSTAEAIKRLLGRFHEKQDYEIVVPLELLRQAERTKRIFNIVLGSIAAISLLVGGIGIMNIMLASVTERTREIGIRRALGAKRRDIIAQFLSETVLLSGLGGILGIILGVAIPFAVEHLAEMKTIVTMRSLLIAFTISAMVGIIFGIYPAYRAANMDPIEALRHE